MPLYEFDCADCGKTAEILVRSTNWKGTPCPHCGSKKLTKNLSVFASHGGAAATSSAPAAPACGRPGGCGCVGRHNH
jgi:putative FmdB family regulatory protein